MFTSSQGAPYQRISLPKNLSQILGVQQWRSGQPLPAIHRNSLSTIPSFLTPLYGKCCLILLQLILKFSTAATGLEPFGQPAVYQAKSKVVPPATGVSACTQYIQQNGAAFQDACEFRVFHDVHPKYLCLIFNRLGGHQCYDIPNFTKIMMTSK